MEPFDRPVHPMRSRRELLTRFGLGAAGCAVATPGAAHARRATLRAFANGGDHRHAPWWLLEPLEAGDDLGEGWTISDLSAVRKGAAILVIHHPEHGDLDIHICSHDGAPRGYVHTVLFDLIAMDGGHGDRKIGPTFRAVLQHIADQIESNELRDDDDVHLQDVERMMTHGERVQTFGPVQL
jgi:hypothetical protein